VRKAVRTAGALAAVGALLAFLSACGSSYQTPNVVTPDVVQARHSEEFTNRASPMSSYVETIVHNFTGTRYWPSGPLIQNSGGVLFGTTQFATSGLGAVYKVGTGGTVTALYTFSDKSHGGVPTSGVIEDSSGSLYGTNEYYGLYTGSDQCCGTVFKLTSSGSGYSIATLHKFNGSDGSEPISGLTMDASGDLFGVSTFGGKGDCNQVEGPTGCGTVYELTPSGSGYSFSILHKFDSGGSDGFWPYGTLTIDSSGDLYGTTSSGGGYSGCSGAGGCGAVFKLTPGTSGYTESIIYSFEGGSSDGANPQAGLALNSSNGNLFGTTAGGGETACSSGYYIATGCGTIFKLSPSGSSYTESILHKFDAPTGDGSTIVRKLPSALTLSGGQLYGTTQYGGDGVVFQTGPESGTTTTIYAFSGPPDGERPSGAVLAPSSSTLYGVTAWGGSGSCGSLPGCGSIYKLVSSSAGHKRRR
jgi:hypothetical protein